MKANINGPGHITNMADMVINSKNHYKSSSSENQKAFDFETWPEALMNTVLKSLYKS